MSDTVCDFRQTDNTQVLLCITFAYSLVLFYAQRVKMAAAVGPSHASATENTKVDQPPKSYREAVGGSKVAPTVDSDTVKTEAPRDMKTNESETVKSKDVKPKEPSIIKAKTPASVKDRNGGQEKITEKDSNQDKEKVTVKKFDPKTYVEAPPPKTNPWKKSSSLDTPPPTPDQVPQTRSSSSRLAASPAGKS